MRRAAPARRPTRSSSSACTSASRTAVRATPCGCCARSRIGPATLGYRRLALETGLAQPEAIALYESAGYQPLPGFGHYAGDELSRAYVKDLA